MLPEDFHEDVKSVCVREGRGPQAPLLSIVIPTYKRAELLEEAIDSALTQDGGEAVSHEILVVNDAPGADMGEITRRYASIDRLSFYVNEKNLGQVGNWNRCAILAKGKYVAYLHDDDLLKPNYLLEMGKILRDERYAGAFGFMTARDILVGDLSVKRPGVPESWRGKLAAGAVKATLRAALSFRYLYRKGLEPLTPRMSLLAFGQIYGAPTCGSAFHREKLIELGGWSKEGYPCFDWYSCLRFNRSEKMYRVQKKLGIYRWLANNALATQKEMCRQDLKLIREDYPDEKVNRFFARHRDVLFAHRMALASFTPEERVALCRELGLEEVPRPSRLKVAGFLCKNYCYRLLHNLE